MRLTTSKKRTWRIFFFSSSASFENDLKGYKNTIKIRLKYNFLRLNYP